MAVGPEVNRGFARRVTKKFVGVGPSVHLPCSLVANGAHASGCAKIQHSNLISVDGDRFRQPMLRAALRFARHGARQQKNGAAKHQCIRQVIKAIVEAGAFHYSDRHVDDQLHEEHGQAQPRRC